MSYKVKTTETVSFLKESPNLSMSKFDHTVSVNSKDRVFEWTLSEEGIAFGVRNYLHSYRFCAKPQATRYRDELLQFQRIIEASLKEVEAQIPDTPMPEGEVIASSRTLEVVS